MAVQLVKHILYTQAPMEEFDDAETETIVPADTNDAPNGAQDDDAF